MAIANTSQTQIALIAETSFGVTPTGVGQPAFKNLRVTGESMAPTRQNTATNEIRSDRNIPSLIYTSGGAEGSLEFELGHASFDDILAAVLMGAWSTDVLKNGATQTSFTLEKLMEMGATDQYHRYLGLVLDQLSLSLAVGEIVRGSVSAQSKLPTTATAILTGATYAAASTVDPYSTGAGFASLTMTGITAPILTAVQLQVANNLRRRDKLGSTDPDSFGYGRCNVSGSIDAYFSDAELLAAFLAGTASSLSFTLGSTTAQKQTWSIPNIKFTSCEVTNPGVDQDVMVRLGFQGLYSSGDAASIKVTRNVA